MFGSHLSDYVARSIGLSLLIILERGHFLSAFLIYRIYGGASQSAVKN